MFLGLSFATLSVAAMSLLSMDYSDQEDSMKTRIMMILCLITFLMSCGGGGSSNSGPVAADIDSLDLTGVWRSVGIECYDSSLQNITAVGSISPSSSVGTIAIQGNQYTSESLGAGSSGSCSVSMSRSIVANLQAGDPSYGAGEITVGATSASVDPTTSSCSLFLSFNMAQGNITPQTLNSTYTHNQPVPQDTGTFIINPPYLALASLIQVVGRPTDICFFIYQKL